MGSTFSHRKAKCQEENTPPRSFQMGKPNFIRYNVAPLPFNQNEISEKVLKSLITPIMERLQGLETYRKIETSA